MRLYIKKIYIFSLYYLFLIAYPLKILLNINTLFFFDLLFFGTFILTFFYLKKITNKSIKIFNLIYFVSILIAILALSNTNVSYVAKLKAIRMQIISLISFILPQYLNDLKLRQNFYRVFINSGIVVLLLSAKQFFFGFSSYEARYIETVRNIDLKNFSAIKIFSTIGSPNTLAYFLIILFIIILFSDAELKYKKTYLLLIIFTIFLTKMSIAVLSLLLLLGIYFLFFNGLKVRIIFMMIIPLIWLSIYKLLLYLKTIFVNLNFYISTLIMVFENNVGETASMNARVKMIKEALKKTNFYLGDGLGFISQNVNRPYIIDNHFIRVYSEVGIFGLIVFVALIMVSILLLFYQIKKYKSKDSIVNFLVISITVVFMMTSNLLDNTSSLVIFNFFIGTSILNRFESEGDK
jgi:hypothetical protein